MDWTSNVAVHESASPEFTRERIVNRLRAGEIDPSLLYAGLRQSTLWTVLHNSVSPAQKNPSFAALYETAFAESAVNCRGNVIHLVSLACGSGGKEVRCLRSLRSSDRAVIYTPADVSLEMVLTARNAATREFRGLQCTPLVCELTRCTVLPAILKGFDPSGAERLILFLGTIHNYWPPEILKSILYPLRAQDHLLIGANLAPADAYDQSLERILTQYDNAPTRAWLMGALSEFGLTAEDGHLEFSIQPADTQPSLKRIEARFRLLRPREIYILDETISLQKSSELRVFYSHRFTPAHLHAFFKESGLDLVREWILPEEGLFLCRRSAGK
jgi:L-histidine Nalpha-methyltransferase